jgi:DNA (cytosine-5)-methyltransferase 1
MTDKPPYAVPTMQEIRELPWNGFKVASLFAGGGGSSTGYRMAGFKVVYANEFVPAAQETYRANMSESTVLDGSDIRETSPQDILEKIGMQPGELDVLDGSPPCASFSTVGKRQAKWGKVSTYSDTEQRTDDLFFEYVRILRGVRPKVFVAENVSGLVKGAAKGYFKRILVEMREAGYVVEARLLDAQWLGVPQSRQRIIFIGVREGLTIRPEFPSPLDYRYAVNDACSYLLMQGAADFGLISYKPTSRPSPTLGTAPSFGNGRSPASAVIQVYPEFPSPLDHRYAVRDVLPALRMQGSEGPFGTAEYRPTDRPSPTITTSIGGSNYRCPATYVTQDLPEFIHDTSGQFSHGVVTNEPSPAITVGISSSNTFHYRISTTDGCSGPVWKNGEPFCPETGSPLIITRQPRAYVKKGQILRRLTIPEVRLICSFPSDFVLSGTYAQRWERMGRAVPPVMMSHIAATLRDKVLPQCAG